MLTRFVESDTGEVFRILLEADGGVWMISHTNPTAPLLVGAEQFSRMRAILPPDSFTFEAKFNSQAQKKRFALIEALLESEVYVFHKGKRLEAAKEIAASNGTSLRRVLNLYYRYLATGTVMTRRASKAPAKLEDFDWAIRTYYFSAKRHSLRDTYELLILERYMGSSGEISPSTPTFAAFRHYFYRHGYDRDPQKVIAREGLTAYQRDHRPAFGTVNDWQPVPGAYMMDATEADIYLVSRLDRSVVIGRPIVYLAVDAATQLICGMHVGLEGDSSAVIKCLANAAEDKAEFCRRFGAEIRTEQWPCHGLPSRIITDNGSEFIGARAQELCRRYGIEIESLPPFRPDLKGCVEKAFDLIQQRYKQQLRGKGVIEDDAQERWSVDYRTQATLDLEQFTAIILNCIIFLNGGRLLSDGKTPAQHWLDSTPNLLKVDVEEFRRLALPRKTVRLTRKGFRLNGMVYAPESMEGLRIGDDCELAYDLSDLSHAFVVLEDGWIPCISGAARETSKVEQDAQRKSEKTTRQQAKADELASSIATTQRIKDIVDAASKEREPITTVQNGADIRENRDAERRRMT